jgi:hypothetical protein
MADIDFNCPHCAQNLTADESLVGSEIECPSCSVPLNIPSHLTYFDETTASQASRVSRKLQQVKKKAAKKKATPKNNVCICTNCNAHAVIRTSYKCSCGQELQQYRDKGHELKWVCWRCNKWREPDKKRKECVNCGKIFNETDKLDISSSKGISKFVCKKCKDTRLFPYSVEQLNTDLLVKCYECGKSQRVIVKKHVVSPNYVKTLHKKDIVKSPPPIISAAKSPPMRYKIIGPDSLEYGPVDIDVIREWIDESRADTNTLVCEVDGSKWIKLRDLPDLADSYSGNQKTMHPFSVVLLLLSIPVIAILGYAFGDYVMFSGKQKKHLRQLEAQAEASQESFDSTKKTMKDTMYLEYRKQGLNHDDAKKLSELAVGD